MQSQKNRQPNNGYLIVATRSSAYYKSAINLASSILDFYPEAKIALYTIPEYFRKEDSDLFDHIDLETPNHIRGKLWALPRTPYDITLYIDADCEVRDEAIARVFYELGRSDIMTTKIRPYSGAFVYFDDEGTQASLDHHCGVFLYNNKPKTLEFMQAWWDNYVHQVDSGYWPFPEHNQRLQPWDQYTFWRLIHKEPKFSDVSVGFFPGQDAKWNFVNNYRQDEVVGEEIVIYHYTLNRGFVDAGRSNTK